MKIILNQSVDSLGGEGEILIVKDGYARNYLIPKGWAKEATKVNIIATQKDLKNTKIGEPYIDINLKNRFGIVNAKLWDNVYHFK